MYTFNTTDSTKMSNDELVAICGELFTAKMWKQSEIVVALPAGQSEIVPVSRLKEYQNRVLTVTGAIQ
jgi:hypothetical protein